MKKPTPSYQRHRFPSEIISHAVWLYHQFCLSFREVEELLTERGITVTYETVRQKCHRGEFSRLDKPASVRLILVHVLLPRHAPRNLQLINKVATPANL